MGIPKRLPVLMNWLILLLYASNALKGSGSIPDGQTVSKLPWPFYHTADWTLDYLRQAASRVPEVVRYTEEVDSESGATLPMVTVSDFSVDNKGKRVVVLVFGEHAREIITTEVALWLTRLLIGDADDLLAWSATAAMQKENAKHGLGESGHMGCWIRHLLRNTVFKVFPPQTLFVDRVQHRDPGLVGPKLPKPDQPPFSCSVAQLLPIVNLEGRRGVDTGSFCIRKKLNGVDLNRNYPIAFQKLHSRSQDYGGPHPFSEPESRIIRAQVTSHAKPAIYVAVHSGEWALYVPWDSRKTRGEDLPADTEDLLLRMNTHCKCMNGPAGKVAGYLALGSGMDYVYATARVPYPLTVEVYGPNGLGTFAAGGHPRHLMQAMLRGQHTSTRCLTEFNPHTEQLYQETVAKWVGSFLLMADFLAPFDAKEASEAVGSAASAAPLLDVEQREAPPEQTRFSGVVEPSDGHGYERNGGGARSTQNPLGGPGFALHEARGVEIISMMSTRDVSVSTGGEERVGRHIGRQGMRGKGGQPAPQKFGSLVAVSALVVVGGAILWLVKLRMFQDKMRTV